MFRFASDRIAIRSIVNLKLNNFSQCSVLNAQTQLSDSSRGRQLVRIADKNNNNSIKKLS